VKKERARRLRALGDALAADHARSFVGREVEVLAEADGTGWTERYVRVRTGAPRNALFRARGAAVRGGVLLLDGPAQVPS
jgi:tRNA A37 methylthiotransferase MiaB